MNINEKVSARIKELRVQKHMTAEKLAWYSDLSKAVLHMRKKKAQRDIRLSTIESILQKVLEFRLQNSFNIHRIIIFVLLLWFD